MNWYKKAQENRFPKPYKTKAKLTKQEVINERLKGLKHFDEACKITPKNEIIKKAIEISKDPKYYGLQGIGKDNTWGHFSWAFGNAWREALNVHNLGATFNLDEALTPEEISFIAHEMGITESYNGEWPRGV